MSVVESTAVGVAELVDSLSDVKLVNSVVKSDVVLVVINSVLVIAKIELVESAVILGVVKMLALVVSEVAVSAVEVVMKSLELPEGVMVAVVVVTTVGKLVLVVVNVSSIVVVVVRTSVLMVAKTVSSALELTVVAKVVTMDDNVAIVDSTSIRNVKYIGEAYLSTCRYLC